MGDSPSLDRIDELIANTVRPGGHPISEDDFDDETRFDELGGVGADSLALIELAEIIQEDYGVEIEDEDLENIDTVGDVKEFVSEALD